MLYAIVSDIHANLTAWKAVLADLAAMKADKIICLGDVVGYGPEPAAVLESVYRHVDAFVMGNHDAVVAGKMSAESFNDHAREMIEWTAARISPKGRQFLGRQPLVLCGSDFVCTHGALDCPAAFNYVLTPEDALATWNATDSPLIFVGHTHEAGICVLGASGTPHMLADQDFEIEEGKRYIVNVGSVGDPRDADPRSSYCLYDDVARTISFRRVAFDYGALREAVAKAGLPEESVFLLRRDMVDRREPVREALGFEPPRRAQAMAQDVAESADLSELKKANSKLRFVIAALIVLFSGMAGVATGMAVKHMREATVFVPADPLPPVETVIPTEVWRNQLPAIPAGDGLVPAQGEIAGWRYSLANPELQRLSLQADPGSGQRQLVVHNDKRLKFVLEAPEWLPNGFADGYRARVEVQAQRSADFSGSAAMKVVANRLQPDEKVLLDAELNLSKPGMQPTSRRMKKSDAFRLGPQTGRISFLIEAEFSGTLTLADLKLDVIE